MSDLVKLSAALPADDELNGLDDLADQLNSDPTQLRAALITFDVSKIVFVPAEDRHVPYVRIRAMEPLGGLDEIPKAVLKQIALARERRTGKTPLPIDAVTVPKAGDDDDPDIGDVEPHLGRGDVSDDLYIYENES